MFTQIALSSVPIGTRFSSPIFDEQSIKLVGAGTVVTEHLIEGLRRRAIDKVIVSQADAGRLQAFTPQGRAKNTLAEHEAYESPLSNDHSRLLDKVVSEYPAAELQSDENPFSSQIRRPGAVSVDKELMGSLADKNEQNVQEFAAMAKACFDGDDADFEQVQEITTNVLQDIVHDIDAVAGLAANPSKLSYPSRHSQHVAQLAMAIGTTLGLDDKSLSELSFGCLIHDIGMLAINRQSYETTIVLDSSEFAEITKHPLKTFEIIEENLDSVPMASRMVAYQIHERCNGSGYPRRRVGAQIHPLAKLAAVADAYTALVAPRPHRPGLMPYCAMEKMIRDVRECRFESKAVRALLETLGLFPVGSYLAFENDFVGRVIRVNGPQYARPIVEVWKRGNLSATPAIVDLANDTRLKIEKPLPSLQA